MWTSAVDISHAGTHSAKLNLSIYCTHFVLLATFYFKTRRTKEEKFFIGGFFASLDLFFSGIKECLRYCGELC